jgi:molecular chaperone DnaJ
VRVEPDEVFERHGQDVFAVLEVPMVQAALGAEVEVEVLDGIETVALEPGTQSGATLRLKGKGVPNLGRRGRGDLFLTVQVITPRDLSKEERRLLEEVARLRDEPAGKKAAARGNLRRPGRAR